METTTPRLISPPAQPPVDLAACQPGQLEIAALGETSQCDEVLPYLTEYCHRAHDRVLKTVVAKAADGTSGIVTLVGDPATGKKRALWEAAHAAGPDGKLLLSGWKVWPGLSPSNPAELLHCANLFPRRTVVVLPSAGPELMRGRLVLLPSASSKQ